MCTSAFDCCISNQQTLRFYLQELGSLLNEHFGLHRRTNVSQTVPSEQADKVKSTETEWREKASDVERTTQKRLERYAVQNEKAAGVERRGDIEDTGTDQESDDGVTGVGCECKNGSCLYQFRPEAIDVHREMVRDMEKDEKEMYVMETLQTIGGENTRGGKRKRVRYGYSFEGKIVCRRVYRYIFDIGDRTLRNIMCHITKNGRVPRVHGNKGRKPPRALQDDDVRYCVDFLVSYADLHGMRMTAGPRGRDEKAPVYLPAGLTKQVMHTKYLEACVVSGRRSMQLTSFKALWNQYAPHIKISSQKDDVCHRCETIRKKIVDSVTEQAKLEASRELQTHIKVCISALF